MAALICASRLIEAKPVWLNLLYEAMRLADTPSPAPAVGAMVKIQSSFLASTAKVLVLSTAWSAMPATAVFCRSTIENVPPTEVPPAPLSDGLVPAM